MSYRTLTSSRAVRMAVKERDPAPVCESCMSTTRRLCRRCGQRICRACAKSHQLQNTTLSWDDQRKLPICR